MRLMADGDGLRLAGGLCADCGHRMIPQRAVCPACGGARVGLAAFGPDGVVRKWSDLTVSVDGVEAPYWVGLVELAEGPVLFVRLASQPEVGQRVRLAADAAADVYWFEAVGDEASAEEEGK
ncbi:MAG TPA: OB-fold domain-containing protein [Anaerolineales bacterium]|jgi:hypothetical protein